MLLYGRTMEASDTVCMWEASLVWEKWKRSKVVLWAALAFAAQEREAGTQ